MVEERNVITMNEPSQKPTGFLAKIAQDIRQALVPEAMGPDGPTLNRFQRLIQHNVRIFFVVARWDVLKQLKLHAQALTYDTLLALVPLLAVIFSIFKGLGGMERVQAQISGLIIDNLSGSPELRDQIGAHLEQFVGNIHAGKLGILSVIILVWSVLSLLGHIEFAFNRIYGTSFNRPWLLRLLTYWSLLTFGPILLAASFALTAALQSSWVSGLVDSLGVVSSVSVHMSPFLVTWLALTVMYVAVPNTRVRLGSAAAAGFIAGLLWTLAKYGYAAYISHNLTLQNIYGSVAAIPLFILWLYVTWLLVLFGAQLAFAFQNSKTYQYEDPNRVDSLRTLEFAACAVMLEVAHRHLKDLPPPQPGDIGVQWGIPRRLLETALNHLREGEFIHDISDTHGLAPAKNLSHISPQSIMGYLRQGKGSQPTFYPSPGAHYLHQLLNSLELVTEERDKNLDFREIIKQLEDNGDTDQEV